MADPNAQKIDTLLGYLHGIDPGGLPATPGVVAQHFSNQPPPDPFTNQPPPDPFTNQPPPDPFTNQPRPDPFHDQPPRRD